MKIKDDFYDMMAMKWLTECSTPEELLKSPAITREREEMISGTITPFEYPKGSNQAEMQSNEKEFYGKSIVDMTKNKDVQVAKTLASINRLQDSIKEAINPTHYKGVIGEFQYIECMEFVLGKDGLYKHLLGQAYKYMLRLGKKDAESQELGKAIWYLRCAQILLRDGTIVGKLKELE